MSHVILNDLWSRKRRLAGMFTAVLVGVAFLAGTLVLGDSVRNSFGTLFTEANRDTDAVVRSTHRITAEGVTAQDSIPESLVGTVARVDGVTATAPLVEGQAQLLGADGDPHRRQRAADDRVQLGDPRRAQPVADRRRSRPGRRGRGRHRPRRRRRRWAPRRQPHHRARPATGARDRGRHRHLRHRRQHGRDDVHRVHHRRGAAPAPRPPRRAHRRAGARRRRRRPVGPGGAPADLAPARRHRDHRAPAHRRAAGRRRKRVPRLLPDRAPAVFAGVALLVAAFSIYNAFSIVTAQRTRESALLRALGGVAPPGHDRGGDAGPDRRCGGVGRRRGRRHRARGRALRVHGRGRLRPARRRPHPAVQPPGGRGRGRGRGGGAGEPRARGPCRRASDPSRRCRRARPRRRRRRGSGPSPGSSPPGPASRSSSPARSAVASPWWRRARCSPWWGWCSSARPWPAPPAPCSGPRAPCCGAPPDRWRGATRCATRGPLPVPRPR